MILSGEILLDPFFIAKNVIEINENEVNVNNVQNKLKKKIIIREKSLDID